jgi:hypothetical protein
VASAANCQRALEAKYQGSTPRSRGLMRPRFYEYVSLEKTEGAGKAGCRLAPMAPCAIGKHRGRNHRCGRSSGLPCAMVLTVSFVLFPVTGLSCHRRFAGSSRLTARSGSARHPQTLAPASGRQNHTTSPSAIASLVLRAAIAHEKPALRSRARAILSRPPHSGPTSVTTRTPLIGPGCEEETTDLGEGRSELFLRGGLDDPNQVERVWEIRF